MLTVVTDYMNGIYQPDRFTKTVDDTIREAKEVYLYHRYDAFAFTGCSGAALAYILSYKMGIPLICVRKESDNAHYRKDLEGYVDFQSYLIVDDFVSSGNTLKRIMDTISFRLPKAECVGALMWGMSRGFQEVHSGIRIFGSRDRDDY